MTDNTKAYDHVAYELLTRAHPPELASTLFVDKVLHKPLSLRPTSPDPHSQDARAARRLKRLRKKEHLLKRQKPKPFSAKEKRALGLYEIPKAQQKYELYLGLHQLWLGYMQEILGLDANREPHVTSQSMGPILASADYHGCILEVVRSRCVGRVGCRGIVLKDTKFTFEIITEQNVLKITPKEHTVFRFEVSVPSTGGEEEAPIGTGLERSPPRSLIFELHGSQLRIRPVERATKKFKQQPLDEL